MSLPYYKRYTRDLIDGTIGMGFELKLTYSFVIDLIMHHGGALPDEPKYIAGHLECSVRKWTGMREKLIKMGKLQVIDGLLRNYRADKESESLRKYSDKQAEKRAGCNKINGLAKSTVKPLKDTDTDTDTYINIKDINNNSQFVDDPPDNVSRETEKLDPWPEAMWQKYPHPANRGGKQEAFSKLLAIPIAERDRMASAVDEYTQYLAIAAWQKPAMLINYLTHERWKIPIDLEKARQENASRKTAQEATAFEPRKEPDPETVKRVNEWKRKRGLPIDIHYLSSKETQ